MKGPSSTVLEDNVYMYALEISDPITYLNPSIHTVTLLNLGAKESKTELRWNPSKPRRNSQQGLMPEMSFLCSLSFEKCNIHYWRHANTSASKQWDFSIVVNRIQYTIKPLQTVQTDSSVSELNFDSRPFFFFYYKDAAKRTVSQCGESPAIQTH